MTVNDAYVESAQGVVDGGTLVIAGAAADTGAAVIGEIATTGAAEVTREVDPDGDGTFEVSVVIDSFSVGFHSQGNDLLVSQSQNTRLVVTNTSGGAIDAAAIGYEVDD
jgi:hypothetical protein